MPSQMYKRLHIKQPSRHILNKLESSRQIFEYTQTSNIMKIRPVGEEVSLADGHTDGRTDIYDEANSRFS